MFKLSLVGWDCGHEDGKGLGNVGDERELYGCTVVRSVEISSKDEVVSTRMSGTTQTREKEKAGGSLSK